MRRSGPLGLAHLTMLDVAPPDWVDLAADAGFDSVGVRVLAAGEEPWPMTVGSAMVTQTRHRLDDTGVRLNDVELAVFRPDTDVASFRPLLEVGAELGAAFVNVIATDSDQGRVRDNFELLAREAGQFGLRPLIEPMVFLGVRNVPQAVAVARGSGGGVLPDYQLCDAPLAPPIGLPRSVPLSRGQSMEIGDLQFEARGARLLPGDGELPLVDFVATMPAGVPISIKAPNSALLQQIGAPEFARRARRGLSTILAAAGLEEYASATSAPLRSGLE